MDASSANDELYPIAVLIDELKVLCSIAGKFHCPEYFKNFLKFRD